MVDCCRGPTDQPEPALAEQVVFQRADKEQELVADIMTSTQPNIEPVGQASPDEVKEGWRFLGQDLQKLVTTGLDLGSIEADLCN